MNCLRHELRGTRISGCNSSIWRGLQSKLREFMKRSFNSWRSQFMEEAQADENSSLRSFDYVKALSVAVRYSNPKLHAKLLPPQAVPLPPGWRQRREFIFQRRHSEQMKVLLVPLVTVRGISLPQSRDQGALTEIQKRYGCTV